MNLSLYHINFVIFPRKYLDGLVHRLCSIAVLMSFLARATQNQRTYGRVEFYSQ